MSRVTFSEDDPHTRARAREAHASTPHGFGHRNRIDVPRGPNAPEGKFGRMFGHLPGLPLTDATVKGVTELGEAMVDAAVADGAADDPAGDNDAIPAGYTYLGQFLDHDITFDTTSLEETLVDPSALENFRTPMLELDALYGAGPAAQPYLYAKGTASSEFQIGLTSAQPGRGDAKIKPLLPFDLPRGPQGIALIGDPRNDENLIVGQLHLAFMRFHNKIVRGLASGAITPSAPVRKSVFEEARDLVVRHYQWIVLHDFLPRLLDEEQLEEVKRHGRRYFRFHRRPFIPVEFAAAAYRLGHSMVRASYDFNRVFTFKPGGFRAATLERLFTFSGRSGTNVPIPSDWIADFRRLFPLDEALAPSPSRRLDARIAAPLAKIPNVPAPSSLAVRNLLRGLSLALPTGQSVARRMGFAPLAPNRIAEAGKDGEIAARHNLHVESPLWYYILKEAELQAGGRRLGQVGSRICAEVFWGLLEGDPSSLLNRAPGWRPTLPSARAGSFTMADLLRFAGDLSPVDDPANLLP